MKKIIYALIIVVCIGYVTHNTAKSQTTYTLGSGNIYEQGGGISAIGCKVEDSKVQYLIRASELANQGATEGIIVNLALKIYEVPAFTLENFNLSLKETNDTVLECNLDDTGFTNVFSEDIEPSEFTADSWKIFPFDAGFYWDGSSNLLIQFCFDNQTDDYTFTNPGGIYVYTPGSYDCTNYSGTYDDAGCSLTSPCYSSTERAQMQVSLFTAPYHCRFHNLDSGGSPLTFNNAYISDNTPAFSVSATHTTSFDRFQVELNTESDFTGTAYTQTFSDVYSTDTQYELDCNSLSPVLPNTNDVTYYVRVRASADGGSTWGEWSSGMYSFTYKLAGHPEWLQAEEDQFESGIILEEGEYDFGNTSTHEYGAGSLSDGRMFWYRCYVTELSYLQSLSVQLRYPDGNVKLALYDESGEFIAETTSEACIADVNTLNTTTNPLLGENIYYVAVMLSSDTQQIWYSENDGDPWGRYYDGGYVYGNFPSSLPASPVEWNKRFNVFLTTANPNEYISPPIKYAFFDGADSWGNITWNTGGADTITVGAYTDADVTTEIPGIPPSSTSPVDISGIDETTYDVIYLKATLEGGNPVLENWKVSCNYSMDMDSEAENPVNQVEAAYIDSSVNTDAEAQEVFAFKITDMGTADDAPTMVTNVRIKPGINNTAGWTDHIQGVKLYDNDGSSFISTESPVITDTCIDIPVSPGDFNIPDGTSKLVSLYVYLNTSNIVDGAVLHFHIDCNDHGFSSDSLGSGFAEAFSSADIESNNMTVTSTPTSIKQTTNIDSRIYPNPFDDKLFIGHNLKGVYDVTILNAFGSVLYYNTQTIDCTGVINTGFLTQGAYVLILTNENSEKRIFRVIKK
jgi:hypothetical protein